MAKKSKLPVKLVNYLDKAGIDHKILEHKTVYTAFDAAATMGKKLNEIAKSLLIKADKDYYLVLLPADHNLDFKKIEKAISKQSGKTVKSIKIPGEKIMTEVLKIKAGSLSAFGGLHKIPVIFDKGLEKAKRAVFSSGSFNHSVEMATKDFVKLENVLLGTFGVKRKIKKVKKQVKDKKKQVVKKKQDTRNKKAKKQGSKKTIKQGSKK